MFTPEETMKLLGSPEEIAENLPQFSTDNAYFDAHRAQWFKEYGAQWVVVSGEKLVAVAPTFEELRAKFRNTDMHFGDLVVKFLKVDDRCLILTAA